MMKTRKRNTGVVQHAAIIRTGLGHQVSAVGQVGDGGAVKDVEKKNNPHSVEFCQTRWFAI